jgi:hypothetical protein
VGLYRQRKTPDSSISLTEVSGEFGKVTETNTLLGSIVQAVTGGITTNLQVGNRGKVSNYERIIKANCRQRRKFYMLRLSAKLLYR